MSQRQAARLPVRLHVYLDLIHFFCGDVLLIRRTDHQHTILLPFRLFVCFNIQSRPAAPCHPGPGGGRSL